MKNFACALWIAFVFILMDSGPSTADERYDVIVVGAGMGGVGAAIQAARMDLRVAVFEETDWIGGQATAAGVSTMDESKAEEYKSGIYAEFIQRVIGHYARMGKSVGTCYYRTDTHCFEPAVGQRILREMIAEANARHKGRIDLFFRATIKETLKNRNRILGVTLADGRSYAASITIDATEYGDLLPLAGAAYRLGNSTSDHLNFNSCIQDITYAAILKKYPNGPPEELLLKEKPPGYDQQSPYFKYMISPEGMKWPGWPIKFPVDFVMHNAYRGIPDSSNPANYDSASRESATGISKTTLNWANDFPRRARHVLLPGEITLGIEYIENRKLRFATNCMAKLRTLQLLYYIQHELGESRWSIADDEGYDTQYNREENTCPELPESFRALERRLPVMPYVREARRMVGVHTLTAKEIFRSEELLITPARFMDAVALAGYATDLHNCKGDNQLESEFESGKYSSSEGGRFQIPLGSFIPDKVDGFLAAEKNISASRLVNGAIRVQPSAMLTGQAVGAIAALSIRHNIQPRTVAALAVQKELVKTGVELCMDKMDDVRREDPSWGAIQLVCVREVMGQREKNQFCPSLPITRKEVEDALDAIAGGNTARSNDSHPNAFITHREFADELTRRFPTSSYLQELGRNNQAPISRGEAASIFVQLLK